jgi:predicted DNA-binding transcriptional regulator YafY
MSYSSVYQRHQHIVNILKRKRPPKPSTADIQRQLNLLDVHVSLRTVERDLARLTDELGTCIVRKGSHPDHWYEIEESDGTALVGNFLDHTLLTETMRNELAERDRGEPVIFMDGLRLAHGLEHMPLLAQAARKRNKVRIVHRKFGDEEASEREVCPLFLKQFQQRWYLVAREAKGDQIKSFGLERIEELEALPDTFRVKLGETHEKLYGHVFGLYEREHNPVLVRLWSSRFHANYLRTLPLHPSQREEPQELDEGVVFTFFLTPNYEFLQAILKMETQVRLLSPESAVVELQRMLRKMLGMYA